jgi:hypothetical protein
MRRRIRRMRPCAGEVNGIREGALAESCASCATSVDHDSQNPGNIHTDALAGTCYQYQAADTPSGLAKTNVSSEV